MQELSLQTAVSHGVWELNSRGLVFNPHGIALANDFQSLSPNYSGVIAFPAMGDRAGKGYGLVKFTKPNISVPDTTAEELWKCVKKHYGLAAFAGIMGVGGMPVEKMKLGHAVRWKASKKNQPDKSLRLEVFPEGNFALGITCRTIGKG